ncbi:MAG: DUF86 domain-containing protein [Proteobacteria bacterium]|nr:DUF86 domain-containing protein [Pseudomonadota bacterium]
MGHGIRALEIVGEAANKARVAAPALQSSAPEIPWDVTYGMRNRIVHDYFEVDLDVVWQTIQRTCLCCVRRSCSCCHRIS